MDDDDELVQAVRDGDVDAYGALFVRHGPVARRVAVRRGLAGEADDVVSEVFARVLAQIRLGRGPSTSFRAYLLTAIRHEAVRRAKVERRCEPVADLEPWVGPFEPPDVDDRMRAAYAALPERWQRALWQLEVEGRTPQELAPELGLSANAVSALGYRARVALRSAYAGPSRAA